MAAAVAPASRENKRRASRCATRSRLAPIAVASPPTDAEPPSRCNSSPPWWWRRKAACTKRQAVSPMVQSAPHQLTYDIDDGDLDARSAQGRPAGPAGPAGGTAARTASRGDVLRSEPLAAAAVASAGGSRPPRLPRAPPRGAPPRASASELRSAASCSGPPRPPQRALASAHAEGRRPKRVPGAAAPPPPLSRLPPERGRGGHSRVTPRAGRGSNHGARWCAPRRPNNASGRGHADPHPLLARGHRRRAADRRAACGNNRRRSRARPGRRTAPPPLLLDETVEDDLGSDEGSSRGGTIDGRGHMSDRTIGRRGPGESAGSGAESGGADGPRSGARRLRVLRREKMSLRPCQVQAPRGQWRAAMGAPKRLVAPGSRAARGAPRGCDAATRRAVARETLLPSPGAGPEGGPRPSAVSLNIFRFN